MEKGKTKSQINYELIEKFINILKEIFISKKDVFHWNSGLAKNLEKLHEIFSFHSFFRVSIKKDKVDIVYFSPVNLPKKKYQYTLISQIFDVIKETYNFDLKIQHVDLTFKHVLLKFQFNNNNNLILYNQDQDQQFILRNPFPGEFLGIGVLFDNINSYNLFLAELILSIMTFFFSSLKEVSELINELEHRALKDPLTDVYNKSIFKEMVEKEILIAKRQPDGNFFSLILIDLDNFKKINDTEGHLAGDLYLKTFAKILKRNIRKTDIVARVGGDEFCILLRKCKASNATRIVSSIREDITKQNLKINFSAGISEYPDHGDSFQELFAKADHALYVSKNTGKGKTSVGISSEEINNSELEDFICLQKINKMLKNDTIIPYFQPIVDITTNPYKIIGYEVFARFVDNNNLLPTQEYINLLKKHNQLLPVTKKVINKALKIKKRYFDDLMIFLNLSVQELRSEYFIPDLVDIIEKMKIKKSLICFEIVEDQELFDTFLAQKNFWSLINSGFKIALDNFMPGYSNFLFLASFQVNYLKLGYKFVNRLKNDKKIFTFFKGLKAFCENLGLKIIAEGVEDPELLNLLKQSIHLAQGFYIAPPQPYEKLFVES